MEQYIPKAALVAEIERRIEGCAKQREDMLNVQCHALADDASARMGELNCIQDFLDTLEVKEVDFEKELDSIWFDNKFGDLFDNSAVDYTNVREICKYFFELGMSVGNKAQKGEEV